MIFELPMRLLRVRTLQPITAELNNTHMSLSTSFGFWNTSCTDKSTPKTQDVPNVVANGCLFRPNLSQKDTETRVVSFRSRVLMLTQRPVNPSSLLALVMDPQAVFDPLKWPPRIPLLCNPTKFPWHARPECSLLPSQTLVKHLSIIFWEFVIVRRYRQLAYA